MLVPLFGKFSHMGVDQRLHDLARLSLGINHQMDRTGNKKMQNGLESAKRWINFICERSQFPSPVRLRAQFDAAQLSEFCTCGCNSFRVDVDRNVVEPLIEVLVDHGHGGAFFSCDFYVVGNLHHEMPRATLEFVLMADQQGYLSYMEVDHCANSSPVPEDVRTDEAPFHVHVSERCSIRPDP